MKRWLTRRRLIIGCMTLAIAFVIDASLPRMVGATARLFGDQIAPISRYFEGNNHFATYRFFEHARVGVYEFAARRQSVSTQVRLGERIERPLLVGRQSTAMSQIWLYGAYSRGYQPSAFVLASQLNPAHFLREFGADVQRQSPIEPAGSPEETEARNLNLAVEHRLNLGALSIGAEYANYLGGTYDLERIVSRAELDEMLRRARRWFDFDKTVEPVKDVNCDDYAEYVGHVVAGRLSQIRTCLDQKRASPMAYWKWRGIVACAKAKEKTWARYDGGVLLVATCEKEIGGGAVPTSDR